MQYGHTYHQCGGGRGRRFKFKSSTLSARDFAQGNITTVSVETRTLGAKRSSWTTAVLCWPDHDLHAVSLVPGQSQGLGTCI